MTWNDLLASCARLCVALWLLCLPACDGDVESPPQDMDRDGGMGSAGADRAPATPAVDGAHPALGGTPITRTPASATPPPIQGGTLLVSVSGEVVISDPDHDQVHVVDPNAGQVLATFDLERGSEPGRLVEDADGRVHVVLRRGAAVATFERADREHLFTRPACPAPHGIAYDAVDDAILVACESGELVTFPAAGGHATRVLRLEPGLRDVIVDGDHVRVSIFKRASLIDLDRAGDVLARPAAVPVAGDFRLNGSTESDGAPGRTMTPEVAWRTRAVGDGRFLMAHQRAQVDEIDIGSGAIGVEDLMDDDGGVAFPIFDGFLTGGSAYGSPVSCDSIVHSTMTLFDRDGVERSMPSIVSLVLPVDVDMNDQGVIAMAAAGQADFSNSPPSLVVMVSAALEQLDPDDCTSAMSGFGVIGGDTPGQVVAVEFDGDERLLVQTRSPNALVLYSLRANEGLRRTRDIPLGPAAVDRGHELYHRAASAGLACASCHPGGGDDGHTWRFAGLGPRRSQSTNVGLAGTAPFHWDGSLATLGDLMSEVFVGRMGGQPPSQNELASLERWLFALRPAASMRDPEDAMVLRGKALFERAGCVACHAGERLTDNTMQDVGTGAPFQVPSLVGVGYRLPVMHDGCAETLEQRFDASCGGSAHGTDDLDDDQIAELVAYLESL